MMPVHCLSSHIPIGGLVMHEASALFVFSHTFSLQLAEGLRGGGHHLTDLYVIPIGGLVMHEATASFGFLLHK